MVGYEPIDWPLECPRDMACSVYEDGAIWPRYVMPDMKTAIAALDPFQPRNLVGDASQRSLYLLFDR